MSTSEGPGLGMSASTISKIGSSALATFWVARHWRFMIARHFAGNRTVNGRWVGIWEPQVTRCKGQLRPARSTLECYFGTSVENNDTSHGPFFKEKKLGYVNAARMVTVQRTAGERSRFACVLVLTLWGSLPFCVRALYLYSMVESDRQLYPSFSLSPA